jgi:hypothetical protein
VAFACIGLAHADSSIIGSRKLSVGAKDDRCVVTLAAHSGTDMAGTLSSTGDCNGVTFVHWKAGGDKLQLQWSDGTLVAWLHAKNGALEGKRISRARSSPSIADRRNSLKLPELRPASVAASFFFKMRLRRHARCPLQPAWLNPEVRAAGAVLSTLKDAYP